MTDGRQPKVSVVIASYNSGRFIRKTIESVIATGYPALEIVAVDDGSRDDSLGTLRGLERTLAGKELKVYTHPEGGHVGQVATKNYGISKATGKYVCFLDADDTYFPNRFDACIRVLESDSSVDVVCERFVYRYGSGNRSGAIQEAVGMGQAVQGSDRAEAPAVSEGLFLDVLEGTFPVHISSLTVRRSTLSETGGFPDITTSQDSALLMKLLAFDRVRSGSEEPVSAYYIHDESHCSRLEENAEFLLNPIRSMIEAKRWLRKHRDSVKPEYRRKIKAKIENKYYAYCSRVPNRRHRFWRDVVRASLEVVTAQPQLLLRSRFWKTFGRLCGVEAGFVSPWFQK